jgi:hypothetical protein
MARVVFDESEWPLLKFAMPAEMSSADRDAYHEGLRGYWSRGTPFCVLADMRGLASHSAYERRRTGAILREEMPDIRKSLVAVAVILDSAVHRGMLSALLWIVGVPMPIDSFSSVESGRAWLASQMPIVARQTPRERTTAE